MLHKLVRKSLNSKVGQVALEQHYKVYQRCQSSIVPVYVICKIIASKLMPDTERDGLLSNMSRLDTGYWTTFMVSL